MGAGDAAIGIEGFTGHHGDVIAVWDLDTTIEPGTEYILVVLVPFTYLFAV